MKNFTLKKTVLRKLCNKKIIDLQHGIRKAVDKKDFKLEILHNGKIVLGRQ